MDKKSGRKTKYSPELARRMYLYFVSYDEPSGAPSYEKFARSIGAAKEDIEGFRKHKKFERAYRECGEIRRDYLIDHALTRRFDPSFVKFLLTLELGDGGGEGMKEEALTVKLEVSS